LDDGTSYACSDNSTGSAVWVEQAISTSAATANTLVLRDGSGGVAVSTINNLAITAAANSTLTIDEDKGITLYDSITTEFGGYINTDAGGYIVTGVNGNITTGAGGYIQTGIGGHISTNNGGSFATGTGNLTGPNASGTIALTSDIPTVDATIIDGSANAVSGNAVFDALALKAPLISPSFTTPTLGAATATTINKVTITAPATGATLTIADGTSITTGLDGSIYTGENGWIITGDGAGIETSTGGGIYTGPNGYIQTGTNGGIETGDGCKISAYGYISTSAPLDMGVNGYITTGENGYIQTGTSAFISTTAGGSITTGTGNLTGPNTSGTVALINPSSGTQTFTGSQIFSSTTRPTSSGTGTPAATSLITRTDLETQLMSDEFVYVVDDFFGGGSVNTGAIASGPLPWLVTTLIGTSLFRYGANVALSLPCPGGASIQTGTNNRDCGAVSFATNYAGGAAIIQSDFNSSTILKWRFYVQSAMGLRIGLGAQPVAPTFQSTRFIGLTGWLPATVWPTSTAVSVGNYYRPTTPNGRRYYASVAGTTAGTEPVWPTGAASTVTDGGVTWTEDGRDGNANFQYCTRDGTALTGTQTDSGIPYAVGWHTFTLRYLGSNNWGMSVDGASEATLNLSTATITILMQAQAYTTGQKHLLFDYFKFFQRVR
jgi:hypothetical protein